MTSLAMIEAAAARLAGHARLTPLLNAPLLDRQAGRRIFVKAECLQWTGSFKFRGGWAALSAMTPAQRAKGVLAYSSGNHAQGVALAASRLGAPCVIVMPAVGNLTDDNGDGLINDLDRPDIVYTTWNENHLVALHGDETV